MLKKSEALIKSWDPQWKSPQRIGAEISKLFKRLDELDTVHVEMEKVFKNEQKEKDRQEKYLNKEKSSKGHFFMRLLAGLSMHDEGHTASLQNVTLDGNIIIVNDGQNVSTAVQDSGSSSGIDKSRSKSAPFVIEASTMEHISSSRVMNTSWRIVLFGSKAVDNNIELSPRLTRWGARVFIEEAPEDLNIQLESSIPRTLQLRVLRAFIDLVAWEGKFC